jgi:hypothetical protein
MKHALFDKYFFAPRDFPASKAVTQMTPPWKKGLAGKGQIARLIGPGRTRTGTIPGRPVCGLMLFAVGHYRLFS